MRQRKIEEELVYLLKGLRVVVEALNSLLQRYIRHALSETEAIRMAFPGKIKSLEEYGKLYVLRTDTCDPSSVRRFKNVLRRMGYGKLSKKVIVSCDQH